MHIFIYLRVVKIAVKRKEKKTNGYDNRTSIIKTLERNINRGRVSKNYWRDGQKNNNILEYRREN